MIIQLEDPDDMRPVIATREPQVDPSTSVPMESIVFNDEEYYLYTISNTTLLRRKIGSWINVTKFIPLITSGKRALEKEIEAMENTHTFHVQGRMEKMFKGVWTTLDSARDFAKNHGIEDIVAPLLRFERIAHVKYLGLDFYEFFSHVSVDVNIRILREKVSGRVNIDQIFTLYQKLKGSRANMALPRSFYTQVKDIRARGDRTLCGGHWVLPNVASKFAKKHGFLRHVKCITDFIGTPDKCHFYHMDVLERSARNHWIATVCDNDFYGFPSSFKGGLAPKFPEKRRGKVRTKFVAADLTISKDFSVNLTEEGETTKERVTLARRFSDGWMNASALVSLSVMIRLKDLNLEKDHPHLKAENEIYYRDCLEKLEYETVVIPNQRPLNGKWCSVKDSRHLMLTLNVSSTDIGRQINAFLDDQRLAHPTALLENSDSDGDDSDDDVELIGETEFLKEKHLKRKTAPFRDKKFFDEEPSSDEEPYEIHGVSDDEEDVIELDSDSDTEIIPDLNLTKRPSFVNEVRRVKARRISVSSDQDDDNEQPKQQIQDRHSSRKSSLFVNNEADMIPEESEDEYDESLDEIFNGSPKETIDSQPPPDPLPSASQQQLTTSVDQIVKELKNIVHEGEQILMEPRKLHTTRAQRRVREILKKLLMFNAITPELRTRTKLSSMMSNIGSAVNGHSKTIEDLESRWVYECNFSVPSKTPDDMPPHPWPASGTTIQPQSHSQTQRPQQAPGPKPVAHNFNNPNINYKYAYKYNPNGANNGNGYMNNQWQQGYGQPQWNGTLPQSIMHNRPPQGAPPPQQQYRQQGPPPPLYRQGPPSMGGNQYAPQQYPPQQYPPHTQPQHRVYPPLPGRNRPPPPQQWYNQGPHPQQQQQYNNYQKPNPGPISNGPKPMPQVVPQKRGPPGPTASKSDSRYNKDYNDQSYNNNSHYDSSAPKRSRDRSQEQPINHRDRTRDGPDRTIDSRSKTISPQKRRPETNMILRSKPEIHVPTPSRPLSPPSNYCAMPGPHDAPDFGLKELKEYEEEKKQIILKESEDYNELFDGPEMEKYKKATHFEIGTRQDLLWRRDVVFGDSGDGVSMARKIFCMIREKEKRGGL